MQGAKFIFSKYYQARALLVVVAFLLVYFIANKESYGSSVHNTTLQRDFFPGANCLASCFQYLEDSKGSDVTLCDLQAERRGPGQKIVSFSFYGKLKSAYYNGISDNLNTLQTFYPDWVMRLYLDPTTMDQNSKEELCALKCKSDRFDLCSVKNLHKYGDISAKFGMVWRFMPMADPLVDIFVSRDLDSRFSERETAAVKDWISTGLPFHSMRDHPHHGTPVLGGMWGARTDLGNQEKYSQLIDTMIDKMNNHWGKGYDQQLLTQYIWPEVKEDACVHDSYLCKLYPTPHNRPWPTRRKDESTNFVGSIGKMKISATCPKECRPKDHQDWTTC